MRIVATCLVALCLLVGCQPHAVAAPGAWPVTGAVVRGFDPPEEAWGAGHRGVDLAGAPGAEVRTPVAGVVTFAGEVAGRPVVVVSHGAERTTLEPVVGVVPVGTLVEGGQVVGHLLAGHSPCPVAACLHWGLRRGQQYLDPLSLVAGALRLLPEQAAAAVARRAAERERAAREGASLAGPAGPGRLASPTNGRLGSGFGERFHPIFREWRLHAGVDLSASCGTPLLAAADGMVTHVGFDASGGWRLVVSHGLVDGVTLETVYLHAQGYRVRPGDRVQRGQVVGSMGSTGWSTGCHLHFGTKANGRHVNPLRWIR